MEKERIISSDNYFKLMGDPNHAYLESSAGRRFEVLVLVVY